MNKKTLNQFCIENNLDETLVTIYKTEEEKLKAVKQNGYCIRYISNPSEEVQLEAVKEDGHSIQFISNPSEAVQLEAMKKNGNYIQYISNPSETVQLEAVKQNKDSIQYFKSEWFSSDVEELTVAQIEEMLGKRIKIVK